MYSTYVPRAYSFSDSFHVVCSTFLMYTCIRSSSSSMTAWLVALYNGYKVKHLQATMYYLSQCGIVFKSKGSKGKTKLLTIVKYCGLTMGIGAQLVIVTQFNNKNAYKCSALIQSQEKNMKLTLEQLAEFKRNFWKIILFSKSSILPLNKVHEYSSRIPSPPLNATIICFDQNRFQIYSHYLTKCDVRYIVIHQFTQKRNIVDTVSKFLILFYCEFSN